MAKRIISLLFLLAGVLLLASPDIYSLSVERQSQTAISVFQTKFVQKDETTEVDDVPWKKYQEYNEKLFSETELPEQGFTHNPFEGDFEDGLFGYISIPAMDVELPLYLGSTDENMAKGAVLLGGTSLPVGGKNTNAIIAGHRGYRGAPYFREIEKLKVGDNVLVTNMWETLTYTVTGTAVIDPFDFNATSIQQDKDMITLYTCHPYRSHGKYRYLVFCERVPQETPEESQNDRPVQQNVIPVAENVEFISSKRDILVETVIRRSALVISVITLLMLPLKFRKRK